MDLNLEHKQVLHVKVELCWYAYGLLNAIWFRFDLTRRAYEGAYSKKAVAQIATIFIR